MDHDLLRHSRLHVREGENSASAVRDRIYPRADSGREPADGTDGIERQFSASHSTTDLFDFRGYVDWLTRSAFIQTISK